MNHRSIRRQLLSSGSAVRRQAVIADRRGGCPGYGMVWLARYVEEFLQCCSCTHNFWPPPPDEDVVGIHVLLFSLQFCE